MNTFISSQKKKYLDWWSRIVVTRSPTISDTLLDLKRIIQYSLTVEKRALVGSCLSDLSSVAFEYILGGSLS